MDTSQPRIDVNKKPANMLEAGEIITELKRQLAESEALQTATKVRSILEYLEEIGCPEDIDEKEWKCTSRSDKWYQFGLSKDIAGKLHPSVDKFLSCVEKCCSEPNISEERKKIIQFIFNIVDGKIHAFNSNIVINTNIFSKGRMLCAVNCLQELEPEVNLYCIKKEEDKKNKHLLKKQQYKRTYQTRR